MVKSARPSRLASPLADARHAEKFERIAAGRLPEKGGDWGYRDMIFENNRPRKFAIQIDNSVLGFEVLECPDDSKITLGGLMDDGLHSSNNGGFRLRFDVPASRGEFVIVVRIRKLN